MALKGFDWSNFGPTLDPGLVLEQVRSLRTLVKWRRAVPCPNRILQAADHDLNCNVCDGTGFLYTAGVDTKMLITGVNLQQRWMQQGRVDAGTVTVTTEPETKLSWWDKLETQENTIPYVQVVTRATGLVDKLKYPIAQESPGGHESVFRLVSETGVDYALGTDFLVTSDGKIQWNADPGIKFYSVGYLIHPVYIVTDVQHQTRTMPAFGRKGINTSLPSVTVEFPVMALARLDFLFGQENRL